MCSKPEAAIVKATRNGEDATFTLHPDGSLTVSYATGGHGVMGLLPAIPEDPDAIVKALVALEGWTVTP